jgi:hypothetical protein
VDDEIVGFTDAPSVEESRSLTELGQELLDVDTAISSLESQLKERKERRQALVMRELPDYMTKIGQDRIGLEASGVDLVREAYYHANIAADWEPEKRETAFQWLTDNGHEDLIKTTFTMQFPRKMYAVAVWLKKEVAKLKFPGKTKKGDIEMPEAVVTLGVPWNTLTAFVKEQIEKGEALPLETLGATVGWIVKVKQRK